MIKLVDNMDSDLDNLNGRKHVLVVSDNNKVNNKWENDEDFLFQ